MTMKNVLNILLVEDNMIEIMKIRRTITLLNLNHKVIEAKNAEEALLLLQNSSIIPDIILLDLNMPKISGIEFLSVLKKLQKTKLHSYYYSYNFKQSKRHLRML